MIGSRLRSIRNLGTVTVVLPLLFAGCFFNLSEKKDFKSWYYGDPGMAGALGEENCDPYADNIQGQRHPYYLHFRTPEVLLQPQGGVHYPERMTAAGRSADEPPPTCEKVAKGWETFHFDVVDAGLVDVVVPYRKASAVNDHEKGFGHESLAYAGGVVYNTGLAAVMKAPIYIVHDILKTLYIPVAGTYYLFTPDVPPETPAEIIQVRHEPSPGEAPLVEGDTADAPTGSERDTATALPSADTPDAGGEDALDGKTDPVVPSPSAGDDDIVAVAQAEGEAAPVGAEGTAMAEDDELPTIEGTGTDVSAESAEVRDLAADEFAATEIPPDAAMRDDHIESPIGQDTGAATATAMGSESETSLSEAAVGAQVPDGEPAATTPIVSETGSTEADFQAPSEAAPAPPRPAEATAAAPGPPETEVDAPRPSAGDAGTVAAAPAESAPVAVDDVPEGAVEDTALEKAPGRAPVEDQAAVLPSEATPVPGETKEETTLAEGSAQRGSRTDIPEDAGVGAAVATLAAIAQGGTGAATEETRPEDATASPPAGTPGGEIVEEDLLSAGAGSDKATGHSRGEVPSPAADAPVPTASVSPEQKKAAMAIPAPLAPIDRVRIAKRQLRKKVAFVGFTSRNINVADETKTYLQDRLWPVIEEECQKNMAAVRRGDADYPASLDNLVRDQFGRLNSFELITVARFSGLNAIISGTIIDTRVSKELSGILWYKSTQGQLRLTILVEVYDAETGTKLLDQTYIREEEVEELEPGAAETLRDEDQPVLEAALRSVAKEMGEKVCEVLEDQPWRAFISGVNGDRITLSAGQNAGLVPGNILGVYNSQIIDGLNNQQFFLTGEKVGRVQIINVFPNRSEAILIEGQGLRDYSVAIPE